MTVDGTDRMSKMCAAMVRASGPVFNCAASSLIGISTLIFSQSFETCYNCYANSLQSIWKNRHVLFEIGKWLTKGKDLKIRFPGDFAHFLHRELVQKDFEINWLKEFHKSFKTMLEKTNVTEMEFCDKVRLFFQFAPIFKNDVVFSQNGSQILYSRVYVQLEWGAGNDRVLLYYIYSNTTRH
jgi:hypothetical protein